MKRIALLTRHIQTYATGHKHTFYTIILIGAIVQTVVPLLQPLLIAALPFIDAGLVDGFTTFAGNLLWVLYAILDWGDLS